MAEYHNMNNNPASSSKSVKDPFNVVKEKVEAQIRDITREFEQWKRLLSQSNTSSPATDFHNLTQNLKMNIKKVNIDIADLNQTVQIVSQNRFRFKEIEDKELEQRRIFVNDMKAIIDNCEETLNSERTKNKIQNDKRKSLLQGTETSSETEHKTESKAINRQFEREANDFLDEKQQQQLLLEKKQDDVLDDLGAALTRLGDVSLTISEELKVQKGMLDEMDNDMDETQEKMTMVLKKINKMLGNSDKGRIGCIILLFILALVLILAIIYA